MKYDPVSDAGKEQKTIPSHPSVHLDYTNYSPSPSLGPHARCPPPPSQEKFDVGYDAKDGNRATEYKITSCQRPVMR